jgi:hypothetical protein
VALLAPQLPLPGVGQHLALAVANELPGDLGSMNMTSSCLCELAVR